MQVRITIVLFCLSVFYETDLMAQIVINEIVANNVNILLDDSSEFDDFVEVFNAGKSAVDLAGMYFANDLAGKKWKVPHTELGITWLASGAYFIFWFDDDENQGPFHVGLNLSSKGESLYLLDQDGKTVIDSVRFPEQYPDVSYCRIGNAEWSYCLTPTPAAENTEQRAITSRCPKPEIKTKGGFYRQKAIVEIAAPEGFEVYVTLDGQEPESGKSDLYKGPFTIERTTVVRARCCKDGLVPSETATENFFFSEEITLPAVALTVDPNDLYDPKSGLYVNPFRDFEKPVNFEYFDEDGKSVINTLLAIKPFGFTSRHSSKLSFTLNAKQKFGPARINYSFFAEKPHLQSVDGLMLRADVTSGRGGGDRETAGDRVKNELMHKIVKASGGNVDVQAYQPVVLYLNGAYWGLYNLMEQKGKDFIWNNYGLKEIDMLNRDELEVVAGDSLHYEAMLDYINRSDVYQDTTVETVFTMIDKQSLVDYWTFEIYSATHDYHVNIRFWRPKTSDGKWRMLAYDEDSWGKFDEPTLYNLTTEYSPHTIFFWNDMLENDGFRNYFINRFADLLNSVLLPQNIRMWIDEIQEVIKYEKKRDYDRWKFLVNFVEPESQVMTLKEFAEKRPEIIRDDIVERFELKGQSVVTLEVNGPGKVQVNTIIPDKYPWTGVYFQDVPVTLRAVPNSGRHFKGWSDPNFQGDDSILITPPAEGFRITAIFE